MKTIGLLGGMSWESTANYYQAINEQVKQALGGLHSAKICLYSVDFADIEQLQRSAQWDETAKLLGQAAKAVQAGGAECLLICTNTMHKVYDELQQQLTIPVLHIADATAKALLSHGISRVGLLGTRFTMEETFYKGRLQEKFGIDVLVPDVAGRERVHDVIYQELCLGNVLDSSRQEYIAIIEQLHAQGAQAIILGCTEIAMLVQQEHTEVPLFDTTAIHANAAVCYALDIPT